MIVRVSEVNIKDAALVHSLSWKDSHREFCSVNFIDKHDVEHQIKYLFKEIEIGKEVYMLIEDYPVGVVSVYENLIENLYILTEEHNKGYGTKLLIFAMGKCGDYPRLWILDNNEKAYRFYTKYGFRKTGNKKCLTDTLSEIEMKKV